MTNDQQSLRHSYICTNRMKFLTEPYLNVMKRGRALTESEQEMQLHINQRLSKIPWHFYKII